MKRRPPLAAPTLEDAAVALYLASVAASEAKGIEETTEAYAAWLRADTAFKGAVLRELTQRERLKKWRVRLREWEREREDLERERPHLEDVE